MSHSFFYQEKVFPCVAQANEQFDIRIEQRGTKVNAAVAEQARRTAAMFGSVLVYNKFQLYLAWIGHLCPISARRFFHIIHKIDAAEVRRIVRGETAARRSYQIAI